MTDNPLDPFSLRIGQLCHAWAELEIFVSEAFIVAIGMDRGARASTSIADCLDLRDKIAAIKIAVVARARGNTHRLWAEEMISTLDYIDNTLRPRRNRLIHDMWEPHRSGAKRMVFTPKIYRPQARKALRFKAGDYFIETIESVEAVEEDIREHCAYLMALLDWKLHSRRS